MKKNERLRVSQRRFRAKAKVREQEREKKLELQEEQIGLLEKQVGLLKEQIEEGRNTKQCLRELGEQLQKATDDNERRNVRVTRLEESLRIIEARSEAPQGALELPYDYSTGLNPASKESSVGGVTPGYGTNH